MTEEHRQPISYKGRVVAHATDSHVSLGPELAALGFDDPLVRFVAAKCRCVQEIERGEVPGPYHDAVAELFARAVWMPDEQFEAVQGEDDADLAARFGVPVEQIALKRRDLLLASFRVL